jgi:cysteine desulfurase / selenocysteine lyase
MPSETSGSDPSRPTRAGSSSIGLRQRSAAAANDRWRLFREQMPVARKWTYLDHAAVAPLATPAEQAIRRWLEQATLEGDTVWPQWAQGVEQARRTAATLIGAEADEVALVPNTTAGISLVAEGLPWREGDNVVTLANEFPSNQYPWMNLQSRGVQTRRVPVEHEAVDLDRLAAACDGRTRLISISWVGYATGWRIDVDEVVKMAHDRGVLVFLDAIQGLGVFPLDVRRTPVDFLAADGHKWMLGPEGAGVFFARREHLDLLRPIGVGWNSVVQAQDFSRIELNLRPTASRYEGGTQNMVGMLGLGASLRMLAEAGLTPHSSPIAERVLQISDFACERLEQIGAKIVSRRDGDHRSGIVSFELPGRDPQQEQMRLLKQHVALSCRAGRLRISPHAYNNEEDIERLVELLR